MYTDDSENLSWTTPMVLHRYITASEIDRTIVRLDNPMALHKKYQCYYFINIVFCEILFHYIIH